MTADAETVSSIPSIVQPIADEAPKTVQSILDTEAFIDRNYWFRQYLLDMTPETARQVLAELEAQPPSTKRKDLLNKFFKQWGEIAPHEALAHAKTYRGAEGLGFQFMAYEGWSRVEPRAAWKAHMEETNGGAANRSHVRPMLGVIARQDLALAMELIKDHNDPYRKKYAFESVVEVAADTNQMGELLGHVSSINDENRQTAYAEALFKNWGKVDHELSLEAVNNLENPKMVDAAMRGMMAGWASEDGQGALEFAIQNASDPAFEHLPMAVVEEWRNHVSPGELDAFMATINQADNRYTLMEAAIFPVARADTQKALQWAQTAEPEHRKGLVSSVLFNMGRTDYEGAVEVFKSLPDDDSKLYSAWAMATNSIETGQSVEQTLGLLDSYENYEKRDQAMGNMVFAATQTNTLHKTAELRAELLSRVESSDSLKAEMREQLLERLRSQGKK